MDEPTRLTDGLTIQEQIIAGRRVLFFHVDRSNRDITMAWQKANKDYIDSGMAGEVWANVVVLGREVGVNALSREVMQGVFKSASDHGAQHIFGVVCNQFRLVGLSSVLLNTATLLAQRIRKNISIHLVSTPDEAEDWLAKRFAQL